MLLLVVVCVVFFKQKTAYEMRISDWSSDVCSSDLGCMNRAFNLLRDHKGVEVGMADLQDDDPAVYGMIQKADTLGVFQIESRAQMSMLPRVKPKCFYDLVIEVAIVWPGPIPGDVGHPSLRSRDGKEKTEYHKKTN